MKVVAADWMPPDRAWVNGMPARLENLKVTSELQPDGSIKVTTTADVRYDPVYQAVIRLDQEPRGVNPQPSKVGPRRSRG